MLKGVEKRLAALNRERKWRQTAATASDQRRHIAASSLPLFVAFCRSGFAPVVSASQSLGDGVFPKTRFPRLSLQ